MIPYILLSGKSNVGKSTLFNNLTNSKDMLISKKYGLTKYRSLKIVFTDNYNYILIDTPGFEILFDKIYHIKDNIFLSIEEANIVLFIIDAIKGVFHNDNYFINFLRKKKKYVFLLVNKIDNNKFYFNFYKLYKLGLGFPFIISAIHNYNTYNVIDNILNIYYFKKGLIKKKYFNKFIKISIIGKSNVGKSTFINSLIKENFSVVYNGFYTTKDNIFLNLKHKNKFYTIIDTYGINLKLNNFKNKIINLYNIKVLQSIIISNLVLFFIDCFGGLSKVDILIAKFLLKWNVGIIIIINKSDLLNLKEKIFFKNFVKFNFNFIKFSYIYFLSSLKNINLNYVVNSFYKIYNSSIIDISTKIINKIILNFNGLINKFCNFDTKFIYAHQGGKNPPLIIIHSKNIKIIKKFYINFFEKQLRLKVDLKGVPLKLKFI